MSLIIFRSPSTASRSTTITNITQPCLHYNLLPIITYNNTNDKYMNTRWHEGETYEVVSKQEHPRRIDVPGSDAELRAERRPDQVTESEGMRDLDTAGEQKFVGLSTVN
jgi:hypothetical protein